MAVIAELEHVLGKSEWPAVVLIAGEDGEARRAALAAILERLSPEERETGVVRMEGGPFVRALDALRTGSLFGGRRVVVVREPELLGAAASDAEKEALKAYLESPPPGALLVLSAEKVDRRLAAAKALAKAGLLVDCRLPKERDVPAWLGAQAKARGLDLHPAAVQALADALGTNTGALARELDKLALLAAADEASSGAAPARKARPIGPAEVAEALGPTRAVGAFALEDALLDRRLEDALDALERHLGADAGPGSALPLLGRLAGMARRLAVAEAFAGKGAGAQALSEALSCHPFVARKYAGAARGPRRAARALAACVAADRTLKSGGVARDALLPVVLILAGSRGA